MAVSTGRLGAEAGVLERGLANTPTPAVVRSGRPSGLALPRGPPAGKKEGPESYSAALLRVAGLSLAERLRGVLTAPPHPSAAVSPPQTRRRLRRHCSSLGPPAKRAGAPLHRQGHLRCRLRRSAYGRPLTAEPLRSLGTELRAGGGLPRPSRRRAPRHAGPGRRGGREWDTSERGRSPNREMIYTRRPRRAS